MFEIPTFMNRLHVLYIFIIGILFDTYYILFMENVKRQFEHIGIFYRQLIQKLVRIAMLPS